MKLAVASGKGGIGKTMLAVAFALTAERPVRLLDCDVDGPNCHLFLKLEMHELSPVAVHILVVEREKCTGCGQCRTICQFNAIAVFKGKASVFPDLCHSCSRCALLCPTGAITEIRREIGYVEASSSNGLMLVTGTLHVGQTLPPTVIRAVKRYAAQDVLTIIDCSPGTACAMVTAVHDADHVLLVTEPTPLGLHDLELAAVGVRQLGLALSVVINRTGIGDNRRAAYCRKENLPVRLQIPDDRRIAEAYSRGRPVLDVMPELRPVLRQLLSELTA